MTESTSAVARTFGGASATFGQGDVIRRFPYFGERLVVAAGLTTGQHVLDVATGRGAVLFPAAEAVGPTGRVIGIDLAPEMIAETQADLASRGLAHVSVQVMDAEHLDFPDATFDAVLCGFGLMFLPHLADALAGFRRVLKPGGRLAVSTWTAPDPRFAWEGPLWTAYGIRSNARDVATQSLWEAAELQTVLEGAGFTEMEVRPEVDHLVHRDPAHWWARTIAGPILARSLNTLDAEALAQVRAETFAHLEPLQEADGIHQDVVANFGLGRNP